MSNHNINKTNLRFGAIANEMSRLSTIVASQLSVARVNHKRGILRNLSVAELPKLYGPHVPVIVLETSDCCTWEPDNSGSLSGVLREPRIIHVYLFEQDTS